MKSKKFILLTIIILMALLVNSYSPPSNMDGRNYYSIYNFTNISADIFYQNGSILSSITDPLNWTQLQNYPSGCSANQAVRIINDTLTCISTINQSNHWDALNTPGDIQISDLDQTGETDLNVNKSNYWDSLNSPSDFTDDSINESAIGMVISCTSGNRLYVSGNDFVCEAVIVYTADETFINKLNNVFTWNTTYVFSYANVNMSNTSDNWDGLDTPADIAISDLDQTGETSLNVNQSDLWDTYDVPSELNNTHNHTNTTLQSLDWTKLQTYPSACPGGTWVTTNADSNTCTAPTAADVEPGTFPAGNYVFQGTVNATTFFQSGKSVLVNSTAGVLNLTVNSVTCTDCLNAVQIENIYLLLTGGTLTGNVSRGDNIRDCYGDADDVCQYWNGSAFITE